MRRAVLRVLALLLTYWAVIFLVVAALLRAPAR